MSVGVWAACVPPTRKLPRVRHFFDDESPLWGCADTTAVCKMPFPAHSTWFIGSVSQDVTRGECLNCLAVLKRREGAGAE